ncbi:hypothetical protein A9X00_01095 [Mycobacterium sp. 1245805.9]|nr:hypothetical protein A9X00_01095 [Mycobacterium sp. 1245805.9]
MEVSIEVMGLPGVISEEPMMLLMSDGSSSRALSRLGGTGSGGGGAGLGLMISHTPTAPTARTITAATAATMGHGLRLGLAGG